MTNSDTREALLHEALACLSDRDLNRELEIAALSKSRRERFELLLAERARRAAAPPRRQLTSPHGRSSSPRRA